MQLHMHFGNDITNSYIIPDLNDQKHKVLKFITKENSLGVIIEHKLNYKQIKLWAEMDILALTQTEHLFVTYSINSSGRI